MEEGKPWLWEHQSSPPPPKQRGAWGHPPTHTALKFYTEGHHVGAKRFYGYTFGLHIGVLGRGGRKPPAKGLQPVPWESCLSGSCHSSTSPLPRDARGQPSSSAWQ